MPRLTIATSATAVPMGAQVYQEEIASRALGALRGLRSDWRVDRMVVRSLRSPLPGNRRAPMGWLTQASSRSRRAVGRLLYPSHSVVHRMNLELPPAPGANVITLHDVVAWKFPDETPPASAAAEEARQADAVICVSHFTASEAVEFLGIRDPIVVHNGVDERFFDAVPASEASLRARGITSRYVLAAGGASRRKNLEALAAAWPSIHSARPDLMLVLSGPEHPRRTALFRGLTAIRMVGRVPDSEIPGLIAAASTVVVPSLYEGFGLPALEAMAARVPVVAARTSSLPEVVGNGGILVEPTPNELAEAVVWATSGDEKVRQTVEAGAARSREFTWERSAAAHAAAWDSLS